MKNSRCTYILLLVFLSTQLDNTYAAVKCYSRQRERSEKPCSVEHPQAATMKRCCHKDLAPKPRSSKTDTPVKENPSCPLRIAVTKTPDAFEKQEQHGHANVITAIFPMTFSFLEFQDHSLVQPIQIINSPPPLFISQGDLRI